MPIQLSALGQIDAVLEQLAQARTDALIALNDTLTVKLRERINRQIGMAASLAQFDAADWQPADNPACRTRRDAY